MGLLKSLATKEPAMSIRSTCAVLALIAVVSCSSAQEPALQTEEERTLYALGYSFARALQQLSLSEQELDVVLLGLRDGVLEREAQVAMDEYGAKVQALTQNRRRAEMEAEKAAADAFVEEAASRAGAVRLESGVVIEEMQAGSGDAPAATDTVRVHYHGTLRDGTVFDSSVERGQPATFALNRVIPCWTQGVQKMRVGGKSRLTCPPDTAYGDRGAGPRIPPASALVFEVELIEIVQ
jgi:FKBP-type peptidyl-prolyl cis-trans isomerase FkpA/FKBP-type peptidyl-prolyl cis-trans isomerase FklB